MGTSGPCPYCGATGERPSEPVRQAVDALYREVALIRMAAEASANQSEEIRMLRETVARLRGSSVAAVQYGGFGNDRHAGGQLANGQLANGQHVVSQRGTRAAHRPPSASSLGPGSRSSSAA